MQKSEEKTKKLNISRVCVVTLLANAFIRLIMLRHISNPIELTMISTGVTMLSISIIMLFLKFRKSELIAATIISSSIGLDIMLYRVLSPLNNPFLWVSVLSLIAIGIAIYIEENGKTSISTIASKKKLLTATAISMFLLPFFLNTGVVKATDIWDHKDLTSLNGKFRASVYVYKYSDVVENKDFYGFWILLHTDVIAYFDWVDKLEIYCPGATFDDWQPREGLVTGGSISITPGGPTVSIAIPLSDTRVNGEYSDTISWFVNPLPSNPQDLEFAAKLWVEGGYDLKWKITIKVISGLTFLWTWHEYWRDTAEWSTIPTPPPPPPPAYRYRGGGGGKCYCV